MSRFRIPSGVSTALIGMMIVLFVVGLFLGFSHCMHATATNAGGKVARAIEKTDECLELQKEGRLLEARIACAEAYDYIQSGNSIMKGSHDELERTIKQTLSEIQAIPLSGD